MEWFQGDISVGISEAKRRNTLYVVYIRDDSDDSKKMDQSWESPEVVDVCKELNLVVIRFLKDSHECKMFSQYYPVLVIPSVAFISGETGVLLEVTAGYIDVQTFVDRIKTTAKNIKVPTKTSADSRLAAQTSQSTEAESSPLTPDTTAPSAATEQKESVHEKSARLRKKMEEVHAKKEAQKKESVRNKETERRKAGQVMQKSQQLRAEQEVRQLADEIKRENREDKMAKQKIMEQIARDRAEKDERFAAARTEQEKKRTAQQDVKLEQKRAEEATRAATNRETARIQFRLPDGSRILHQFPSSATLGEARQYVVEQVGNTFKDFSMSTAFPRRHFGSSDMDTSLLELQLAPSAAVVILPGDGTSRPSRVVSSGGGLIAMLLAPLVFIWNLLYTFIFGTRIENPPAEEMVPSRSSEPSQAQSYNTMGARPKSSYARRRTPGDAGSISRQEGNIHRLNTDDDNDDENNTWNGNSTQQM